VKFPDHCALVKTSEDFQDGRVPVCWWWFIVSGGVAVLCWCNFYHALALLSLLIGVVIIVCPSVRLVHCSIYKRFSQTVIIQRLVVSDVKNCKNSRISPAVKQFSIVTLILARRKLVCCYCDIIRMTSRSQSRVSLLPLRFTIPTQANQSFIIHTLASRLPTNLVS